MTYGYRLNIEDIYLKSADQHWSIAEKEMVEVIDSNPATGKIRKFYAPESPEGVSSSVQAIVGWAIVLEGFVNLAWNLSITNKIPSSKLNKFLMRRLETMEKLKEILRQHNVSLNDKSWLSDLKNLIALRNKLVHFKLTTVYVGHGFAPEYTKDFEKNQMSKFRRALSSAIKEVEAVLDIRTSFINGDYEVIGYGR